MLRGVGVGEQIQPAGMAGMGRKRGGETGSADVLGLARPGSVFLSSTLGYSPGSQRLDRPPGQVDAFL